MTNIINKYKDDKGYVSDVKSLYQELKNNNYDIDIIIKVMNNISVENNTILKKLKKENEKELNILKSKKKEFKNYIKETVDKVVKNNKDKDKINIDGYIYFIGNNLDNFTSVMPKNNNKESILIIDSLLAHYYKEITFLQYNLITDNDTYIIDELNKNLYIYNSLIDYKKSLSFITENNTKNNLVYYMENDIPNVFRDIYDLETKKSIIKLLESIENGTFINIKAFTNNDKLKGIFEVRDLQKRTRVIFEIVDNKYVIICSLIDKTNSNSIYKERLYNQIIKYKSNMNLSDIDDIKRLILEDNYE